ncbi:MAG: TetR family transcriptional regulator [Alphaproteobacteria bacterium]
MSIKKINDTDIKSQIITAALDLAVDQGWEFTTLRDIAEKADISLLELYDIVEDKQDILVLLGRAIDRQVMESVDMEGDDTVSVRDRLFDIMMDRYDILNQYRSGIVAVFDSFKCDPKQAVISLPHLCRSMNWMLEASGVETSGIKGALKVMGLTGIYLKVLKVWCDDESRDLSKTMAALDKALERGESVADTFGF